MQPIDINELGFGSRVRCIRGDKASGALEEGKLYDVLVVVRDGAAYMEESAQGIIVEDPDMWGRPHKYPYVWNIDRFEEVR